MIAALRTHKHRIAFAIALSALAHVLLMWGSHLRMPAFDADLHPLTARLEPLPDRPRTAPARPASKPKTTQPPAANQVEPVSAVTVTETIAASMDSDAAHSADSIAQPSETPSNKPSLLPKHAQLVFSVYRGEKGIYVGEVQHRLDITDQRYSIIASTRTAGVARWFKSYDLNQSSMGTVDASGLHPESFVEEKNDSGELQNVSASFDWKAHVLRLSDSSEIPLGDSALDPLSLLYQFAVLPLREEVLQLNISNGKKLEIYALEIVTEEVTPTAMGDLRTLHLRKLHQPGESGMDIWLAREYRMLPVKMQYIEPDGTIAATISITDIRVSDE